MDCAKIGGLILQLRREQGLTQRSLAQRLGVSPKTVSKWECGRGCPDLSLWDGLSAALGADLGKLLRGELQPNRPDSGNLARTRFYVCPVCGNLLTATGKASLSCCGRRLSPLVAAPADGEHTARCETVELDHYFTLDHPMTKDHYLSFAAWVVGDRVLVQRLYPEQDAAFRLPMLRRDGALYLYCTRHGFFRQKPLTP